MAARNGTARKLEGFMKKQIIVARKRLDTLERDAGRVVEEIKDRGARSGKELRGLLEAIKPGELNLLESPVVKQISQKAGRAKGVVQERLERLQMKVVEAAGVATQAQVRQLSREINRLSRQVSALAGKKVAPPPA